MSQNTSQNPEAEDEKNSVTEVQQTREITASSQPDGNKSTVSSTSFTLDAVQVDEQYEQLNQIGFLIPRKNMDLFNAAMQNMGEEELKSAVNLQPLIWELHPEDSEEEEFLRIMELINADVMARQLQSGVTSLMTLYEQTKDCTIIDVAVELMQQVMTHTTNNHPYMAFRLSNLGTALRLRFDCFQKQLDIDEAVSAHQKAVDLTPEGHTDRYSRLNNLGMALHCRFQYLKNMSDNERAIAAYQQAIDLLPVQISKKPGLEEATDDDDDDKKAVMFHNLGTALHDRYQYLGDSGDIAKAIELHQQAVDLTPDARAEKPARLHNLAGAFFRRFERLRSLEDLDKGISAQQLAVDLTPKGHVKLDLLLNNLGSMCHTRFKCLGNQADIEKAIDSLQQAVELTAIGHVDRSDRLSMLGSALHKRFKSLGELNDVKQAISLYEQAIELTSEKHEERSSRLHNLGLFLLDRFGTLGDVADTEKAITLLEQAINNTPEEHVDRPLFLVSFGNALQQKFRHFGTPSEIQKAISLHQQAVVLTSKNHVHQHLCLTNLGLSFQYQFDQFGNLADIQQAIELQQQAVNLIPDGHADKPNYLNNLGIAFHSKFDRLRNLTDIQSAIVAHQQAVDLTHEDNVSKALYLSNLGGACQSSFSQSGSLADAERAIHTLQQAVQLTADTHPLKPTRLDRLGSAFRLRFQSLQNTQDMEQAIQVQQQAVDMIPDDNTEKPTLFYNLGITFAIRFHHSNNVEDIKQAILLARKSVDHTSDMHVHKASRLNSLGELLVLQLQHFINGGDDSHPLSASDNADDPLFDESSGYHQLISTFQDACALSSGYPASQIHAALNWARLSLDPDMTLKAYTRFFELIPQVVWLGQTIGRRYEELSQIEHEITTAVSTAIAAGKFSKAVEWLEEGRSIVWGQILQLRSPLDSIPDHQLDDGTTLADKLAQVSKALAQAGRSVPVKLSDSSQSVMATEQGLQVPEKLALEYEKLIKQVREMDGLSGFLKPKEFSELASAAENGPVFIVNIDESHCDVMVVSTSGCDHIALPNFSIKQCQELRSKLIASLEALNVRIGRNGHRLKIKQSGRASESNGIDEFRSVLLQLWLNVVYPTLSAIGIIQGPKTNPLPHVTWCPTGALTFLPLHAAGIYGSADPKHNTKASDFVVSSYTTTLSALSNSQSKLKQSSTQKSKVLVVSLPDTPHSNWTSLPATLKEAAAIQACVSPGYTTHLTGDQATIEHVMREMKDHEIVHFACHGVQDTKSPLDSAFALYDGDLKLQELMGLSLDNTRLAVLSACETAAGDNHVPEEAVHLAAGMLAAGYPSVIATMWAIEDRDTPLLASKLYASLFRNHDRPESNVHQMGSAYALHEAVENLRKEVGDMDFARWVPFVHFGF